MKKNIFLFLYLCSSAFAAEQMHYVGEKPCAECHSKEVQEWQGSHHDLAMIEANEKSVKGDFNNATFNYNGIVSTFFKKNDKFMVNTDGPKGKLEDYEISYTFGVYPLQQYMVKFPEGKIQVLDIAWDNRSKKEGGQRWYHLHPEDNIVAGDILHWTGPNLNWNYMCADCHSTNLKKNYDIKNKSYDTTWDSINVSCEACHGPASAHIQWTKNKKPNIKNKGLSVNLQHETKVRDSNSEKSKHTEKQIMVCAKCHSRRTQLDDDYIPGDDFHDHYLPTNLEDTLYFSDGKMLDEVYVHGSFLQSKMYAKGVTCVDCHNPHTLALKAKGDKVCSQCHTEEKYASATHHFHEKESAGASCIGCHMPARTYMGIDKRNDHGFRIPRPDVSVTAKEIPNACNLCHTDKKAEWAAEAVQSWYKKTPVGKQNFSHALSALRSNDETAPKQLYSILLDSAPNIAKATVVGYLGNYPSRQTYLTTIQMLRNSDPSIRRAALEALEAFPPKMRAKETLKALSDASKIMRMEAARQFVALPQEQLNKDQKEVLQKAFSEYEKILLFTAERPESQLSLALFYAQRDQPEKAESTYLEALRLQPKFVPAYVNYSDFLTQQRKNTKAFEVLQRGLENTVDNAALHHALGLWYVRNKEKSKAIVELKKSVELDKNSARFAYVYAVSIGEKNPQEAIAILEEIYPKHTGDLQIVSGLMHYHKVAGNAVKSEMYKEKLTTLQKFVVR